MKKILLCATVDYHFEIFHIPYMKLFKENGWEVHVAAQGNLDLPYVDKKYNIPIQRSPFCFKNYRAYRELKRIIIENQYTVIHCHTPMGGVLGRLAARKVRENGTRVLYTAHGFHFCKGAPLINWIVYYPIEKWLARYTDCLITINYEDYCRAIKGGFKAGRIEHVHGVGVNTEKYRPVSDERKLELRKKYGFQQDDFLMIYAAEFNKNKNQEFLIKTLANIKEREPKVRLLLAGNGPRIDYCRGLAEKMKVSDLVQFLGFRTDLHELLPMCDIAVASSFREGLPVNIMEAMACGLPIVATDNRGHRELVSNRINGFVVHPNDFRTFEQNILQLYNSCDLREKMSKKAVEMVNIYSVKQSSAEMNGIYLEMFMEIPECNLKLA